MGVDGLYKFINRNFPEIFNSISITDIKGKSCIIDGMQHIYSQLIYMRSKEKEIVTLEGKNISHIHGLINSLTYYLKNEIIPIFIFDGKTPEIKRKKIEERKKNLKENLIKLKDLQNQKDCLNDNLNNYFSLYTNDINFNNLDINNLDINNLDNNDNEFIFGTPPIDTINLEEEILKMNNIQEEYKKIYKKSIVMKDYFVKDWIQILELLGLPVIKAIGEADPLCAYLLKKNQYIYGIISDDSDMLVFGSPRLMRKSINQQFTIIELDKILNKIQLMLSKEFSENITFDQDNLIDFSILLGTDYGTFKLNEPIQDSMNILKYYVSNNKNYQLIISPDQYERFEMIKNYYKDDNFISQECNDFLDKPKWNKPKFMELKKRLLELDVDEDYIDKNNEFLDICYNKIEKNKNKIDFNFQSFDYNNYNQHYHSKKYRSNSFDNKKTYDYNKSIYLFDKKNKKAHTFYSDKYIKSKTNIFFSPDDFSFDFNYRQDNSSYIELDNEKINIENKIDANYKLNITECNINFEKEIVEERESIKSIKSDGCDEIFFFEN